MSKKPTAFDDALEIVRNRRTLSGDPPEVDQGKVWRELEKWLKARDGRTYILMNVDEDQHAADLGRNGCLVAEGNGKTPGDAVAQALQIALADEDSEGRNVP